MSSTTGKSWKIARYSGTTPYNVGGIPTSPKFIKHSAHDLEKGTGQRRLVALHATNIYWELAWRMKLQRLDYIIAYAMPSAEADLTAHNLFFTDGITSRGFTNVLIDKCDIEIAQTGSIHADLVAYGISSEVKSITPAYDSDSPMSKASLTTLTVGGVAIPKWTDIRFGVSNNVARVPTGTTDTITELYARDPNYNGRIKFAKTVDPAFGFAEVLKSTIIMALRDNQTVPVTKTFTFTSAAMKSNTVEVQELDLVYETIDWDGDRVTIA